MTKIREQDPPKRERSGWRSRILRVVLDDTAQRRHRGLRMVGPSSGVRSKQERRRILLPMQVRSAPRAARHHDRFEPIGWRDGFAGLRRAEDALLPSTELNPRPPCGIQDGDASFGNRNVNLSANLMLDTENRPQIFNLERPDLDAEKAATVVTDAKPGTTGPQVHGRACGALLGHLKHRSLRRRRNFGSIVENERRRYWNRYGWGRRQLPWMVHSESDRHCRHRAQHGKSDGRAEVSSPFHPASYPFTQSVSLRESPQRVFRRCAVQGLVAFSRSHGRSKDLGPFELCRAVGARGEVLFQRRSVMDAKTVPK
jgi:hypothetical protein